MKTQNEKFDYLTLGQKKSVALLQFNNEDYFILKDDENKCIIYAVDEDVAHKEHEANNSEMGMAEDQLAFEIYCEDNYSEIAEIEGDEEVHDYIVLTDEEADEKARENIKNSLWAFNANFLAEQTDLPEEVFTAIIDNGKCESNNSVIEAIIDKSTDIDVFCDEAMRADGRGHFMSNYDGNENEETVGDTTFYIYRMN